MNLIKEIRKTSRGNLCFDYRAVRMAVLLLKQLVEENNKRNSYTTTWEIEGIIGGFEEWENMQ